MDRSSLLGVNSNLISSTKERREGVFIRSTLRGFTSVVLHSVISITPSRTLAIRTKGKQTPSMIVEVCVSSRPDHLLLLPKHFCAHGQSCRLRSPPSPPARSPARPSTARPPCCG